MALLAVVRIRGSMETHQTVEDTLKQMHLTRKNHCILMQESDSTKGKLIHGKDFITWGPIEEKVVEELLKKHGRITGDNPLTDDYLASNSPYKKISEFAKALMEGRAKLNDVDGLKPLFRLKPPLKGFKGSIKRPFPKGALGNRKEKVNELIARMM